MASPNQNHYSDGDIKYEQGKPPVSDQYIISQSTQPQQLSQTLYAGARLQFVRKVYVILTVQLLVTAAMTAIAMQVEQFQNFQKANQWLVWVCLGFMILSEIVVLCIPAGRRPPTNFIFLGIFTLAESYIVSFICSLTAESDGKYIVFMAAIMTLGITVAATLYAMFTKTDFTIKWGIVIVLACAVLFLGIFSIFWRDRFLTILYCTLGVILFGIYLIIDTQLILGGKRMEFSIDDYAAAAMLLYIDIIQIFLYLLRIMRN